MMLQPATVANELVVRLNQLRSKPASTWGQALEQAKFRVRGLQNVDRGAYLAVSSMISALEGDEERIAEISRQIVEYDLGGEDGINVMLSLGAVGSYDHAEAFALKMLEVQRSLDSIDSITDAVLVTGNLQGVLRVSEKANDLWGLDPSHSEDVDLVGRLLSKANEEEFRLFNSRIRNFMKVRELNAPTVLYFTPFGSSGLECSAMAEVVYECENSDDHFELEEALMDEMIFANDRLFCDGVIALGIKSR